MKIVSFHRDGAPSWGVVEDRRIVDLGLRAAELAAGTFVDVLRAGNLMDIAVAAAGADADWALDDVTFDVPVQVPGKVLCVGLNYAGHVREMGRTMEDNPTIFTRFPDTLVPHGAPLQRPRASATFDYEGELAVVIGSGGRNIPTARALEHVAGWTCFNDASVRDFQRHTPQWTPGKNFPATGGCGPWIVTRDELPDLASATITTRLNEVVVQKAGLDDLVFSVARIISYVSTWTHLSAGDIIATGTPGGVGAGRTPPLWLAPGDRVEVEISGLGVLSNTVIDEPTGPDHATVAH